jgi:hypothetical protein
VSRERSASTLLVSETAAQTAGSPRGREAADLSPILSWYTGRALERVRALLPAIARSVTAECWEPKVSRAARAALSKQTVAQKFARANERDLNWRPRDSDEGLLVDVADVRGANSYRAKICGRRIVREMRYGVFEAAPAILALVDQLAPHARGDAERCALATARRWASDFSPVARLFDLLDRTRPRPDYVFGEISAAVRANVEGTMGLTFETVRVPEIRWVKVPIEAEGGTVWTWVGEILCPPGTRHGASRFGVSASGSDQCQACGHAIRDARNWVPLVLDGPGGPASLWVGRDCARHLFGCRVTGEGTFPLRTGSQSP